MASKIDRNKRAALFGGAAFSMFGTSFGPSGGDGGVIAPYGITLSGNDVEEGHIGSVATLLMSGGTEPATFALQAGSDPAFSILSNELIADGSQTEGTKTVNIEVTDANDLTFSDSFSINVSAVVNNDSGVTVNDGTVVTPDPEDPETNQGGYVEPPVQQDTSAGLKVTGKNGGSATWFKSLPLPPAGSAVTFSYSADWSGMSRQGREAAIGFAFKNGNQYHLAGVRGNGANPASMLASRIHGDFRKANQFTVTNDGAASGAVKDGPNYLRLSVSSDGQTYSLFAGSSLETLTEIETERLPSPLSGVDAALEFGIGGYFTNTDKGVFSITISLFQTVALSSAIIAYSNFQLPSATGEFTISADLGGFVPKAVMFFLSNAEASEVGHAVVSEESFHTIGATDGTNQWSTTSCSESGSNNDARRYTASKCLLATNESNLSPVIMLEAGFVSFEADGVTINISTLNSQLYLKRGFAMFFAGADCEVEAGVISGETDGSATKILGFVPEGCLFSESYVAAADASETTAVQTLGFALNDGSATQYNAGRYIASGTGQSRVNDKAAGRAYASAGVASCTVAFSDVNVTATWSSALDIDLPYLAWSFGGNLPAKAGLINSPQAPDKKMYAGLGIDPTSALFLTGAGQLNVDVATDGGFGAGWLTGSGGGSMGAYSKTGFCSTTRLNLINGADLASLSEFSAEGYLELDFTTADATIRAIPFIAFGTSTSYTALAEVYKMSEYSILKGDVNSGHVKTMNFYDILSGQTGVGHVKTLNMYAVLKEPGFYALAYKSGDQVATSGNVAFGAELKDVAGVHDLVTNNSRFTVPASWNGRYVRFSGNVASTLGLSLSATKNGSSFAGAGRTDGTNTSGDNSGNLICAPVAAATGDYFEMTFVASASATLYNHTATWGQLELMPADFDGALVNKTVTQALAAATGTILTWDNEVYDLNGWHDNVTNNSRLTVPSDTDLIRVSMSAHGGDVTNQFQMTILKNGSGARGLPTNDAETAGEEALCGVSAPIPVTPGDYFEAWVWGTIATDIASDDNVWFAIEKLPSDLKYALVHRSSNQTITGATTTTVNWNAEVADVGGWHDTVTNSSRLTVPAGVHKVRVSVNIITEATLSGQLVVSLIKNGGTFIGRAMSETDTTGTDSSGGMTAILDVVPGDYFECQVYGTGSFAVGSNVSSWFAIEEVKAVEVPTVMPTFVAAGTHDGSTGAVTPGLPTGWAEDDILVVVVSTRGGDVAAAPSGYVEGPSSPQTVGSEAGSSLSSRLAWFWKRATASESAPTVADPGTQAVAIMFAVRGCPTSGDPWDVSAGSVQSSVTGAIFPGVTTTGANRLIVHMSGRNLDNLSTAFSDQANVNLANVTEQADVGTAAGTGGGICITTGEKATAGATGDTTATVSSAAYLANITVAFKGA